jgi:hypothetical protein
VAALLLLRHPEAQEIAMPHVRLAQESESHRLEFGFLEWVENSFAAAA